MPAERDDRPPDPGDAAAAPAASAPPGRRLSVAIVGASGYAGGELLRLLLFHPRVEVRYATSRSLVGEPVSLAHPNLRGLDDLLFRRPEEIGPCDVLFAACPHGESMRRMERWLDLADKVIDLGADFRLSDPAEWKRRYGTDHACPRLIERFVTGLPEIARDELRTARAAAVPGCEAIVSILCLRPFARQGLLGRGPVVIDAKMGSSQAGRAAGASSHHPERAGVVRSYRPTGHRHEAEIAQALRPFAPGLRFSVSATAVEMVRGILVTIHTYPEPPLEEREAWRILRREYGAEPFVRIVKASRGLYRFPEPKILAGTNLCEIGFEGEADGGRFVILGAIDNLVKGTAGTAVQCLNVMSGFGETEGLTFPGLHPV